MYRQMSTASFIHLVLSFGLLLFGIDNNNNNRNHYYYCSGQNLEGLMARNLPFNMPFGTITSYRRVSPWNGAVLLEGDTAFDTRDLLMQRTTTAGSEYYQFHNQKTPLYRRHENDDQKHFVIFPDPLFPHGSGRYIVLRQLMTKRIQGVVLPLRNPIYQSFQLVLEDTLHAFLSKWAKRGQRLRSNGQGGGQGQGSNGYNKNNMNGKGGKFSQPSFKAEIEFSDDGYGLHNMGPTSNRIKRHAVSKVTKGVNMQG